MANGFHKDLYGILNLKYDATTEEIKSAYRKLVRIYHPDVACDNVNPEKFKDIQEAYEILSNENKRKRYDALHGYFSEKLKKDFREKHKNSEQYEEIIKKAEKNAEKARTFTESVNDALDNLFGNSKKNGNKDGIPTPVNGSDIEVNVNISPTEAMNGTTRKVNILHTAPCPKCAGRKFINGGECSECGGIGQISKQKKINVKIPCSVSNGVKVRVKGEGNRGLYGGKDGDLYLKVNIENNSYFETEGLNILLNLPITPYEAVLGCEVPLNVQGREIKIKVPEMVSSGQKLKLSGMGLENKSENKKGNIIITVCVKLPPSLSDEEKELYKKLQKLSTFDIRKEIYNEQ